MVKKIFHLFTFNKSVYKDRYYRKIFFVVNITSSVAFLLFSIILLSVIKDRQNEDFISINQQNIDQAYSINVNVLEEISTYCYNVLDTVEVQKLLYSPQYDIVTKIKSRDTYDSIKKISSVITTIDFVDFNANVVLTHSKCCSLDRFEDQGLITLLKSLSPSSTPYFCYPRKMPYIVNNRALSKNVISLIYYANKNGALVINLDYEVYSSLLNLYDDYFDMYIINKYGTIIASSDRDQFANDFNPSLLYQKVREAGASSGTFTFKDEQNKYYVSYRKNCTLGITYISMYNTEDAFLGHNLFAFILLYSVIYFVIVFLLTFYASFIIYKPLKIIENSIKDSVNKFAYPEIQSNSTLSYLSNAYKHLIKSISALNQYKQDKLMGDNIHQTLYSLIHNINYNNKQAMELLESYFIYNNYLVFIAKIRLNMQNNSCNEEDSQLYNFIANNVVMELFGSNMTLHCLESHTSQLIFIGNCQHHDRLFLMEKATEVQNFFKEIGLFSVAFAFGLPTTDMYALKDSYNAACMALDKGCLLSHSFILFYEDFEDIDYSECIYPYDLESNILSSIKKLNIQSCNSAIEEFFGFIHSHHPKQIHHHVLQLNISLQHFENTNGLPCFEKKIDAFSTLSDMQESFTIHCNQDICLLQDKNNELKKHTIEDINKFIDDNISNPNLSISLIADEQNLSTNYLCSIYKSSTGISINSYITNKKICIMCHLLKNSELSVQEISDQLGFTTKNYLFTFFKKHMNMTPIQYRSLYQNNTDETLGE